MTNYKLGKHPATTDHRDLLFSTFFNKATLPTIPNKVGHSDLVSAWGMLGNDIAGDCVIASGCHLTMLWNKMAGKEVSMTRDVALQTYSKVTGYNPADPTTDRGTNMRAFLKYWRKHGIPDEYGNIHKIGAYVRMDDLTNIEHIKAAIYLFGAVNAGIRFPDYAMRQFQEGSPWQLLTGGTIEGGHCVPIVSADQMINCVTWAKVQPMEVEFFQKMADEAWVIISKEMLVEGCNLEGFNLVDLQKYLPAI